MSSNYQLKAVSEVILTMMDVMVLLQVIQYCILLIPVNFKEEFSVNCLSKRLTLKGWIRLFSNSREGKDSTVNVDHQSCQLPLPLQTTFCLNIWTGLVNTLKVVAYQNSTLKSLCTGCNIYTNFWSWTSKKKINK